MRDTFQTKGKDLLRDQNHSKRVASRDRVESKVYEINAYMQPGSTGPFSAAEAFPKGTPEVHDTLSL